MKILNEMRVSKCSGFFFLEVNQSFNLCLIPYIPLLSVLWPSQAILPSTFSSLAEKELRRLQ